MKAFLLAAGMGTRLRPMTETCPKPLIDVAGKPLIVHHIEKLVAAGVVDIVINLYWLGNLIEQALGDGSQYGATIRYSYEEQLLETGGGLRHAKYLLGTEPFILVSADVYTEYRFEHLVNHPMGDRLAHLVMVDNPQHKPKGDFTLSTAKAETLFPSQDLTQSANAAGESQESERGKSENKAQGKNKVQGLLSLLKEGEGYTYSGISLIHPALIDLWPSTEKAFPLRDPLVNAVTETRVTGEHCSDLWEDVGTIERLQCLRDRLAKAHE